jgi:hypothetical protein
MRKLTYYVACTADRFIARADGSFDCFPTEGEHIAGLIESFPETIPVTSARRSASARRTSGSTPC